MAKLYQHRHDGTYYTKKYEGGIVTRQIHPDGVIYLKNRGVRLGGEIPTHAMSKLVASNWLYTKEEMNQWGEVDWSPDWNKIGDPPINHHMEWLRKQKERQQREKEERQVEQERLRREEEEREARRLEKNRRARERRAEKKRQAEEAQRLAEEHEREAQRLERNRRARERRAEKKRLAEESARSDVSREEVLQGVDHVSEGDASVAAEKSPIASEPVLIPPSQAHQALPHVSQATGERNSALFGNAADTEAIGSSPGRRIPPTVIAQRPGIPVWTIVAIIALIVIVLLGLTQNG